MVLITSSIEICGLPNVLYLVCVNLAQLHMRCSAVSWQFSSQKLHVGVTEESSLFWKWLRLLCPVISLVSGLSISKLCLKRCCPLRLLSSMGERSCFVLLLILLSSQRLLSFCEMCSRIFRLKNECGCGSRCFSSERVWLWSGVLILASLSAISLPSCPVCPGIHSRLRRLVEDRELSAL